MEPHLSEAQPAPAAGRFEALAEHLDQVLWLVSVADRRLLYVTPSYERLWQHPVADLYADPRAYLHAIHSDDRARVDAAMQIVIAGTPQSVEYRVVRPDGSERWVRSRAFPLEAGARIAGITEDVTERRRAEAERERVLEIVGHDLNSPLCAIQLSAGLALDLLESGDAAAALRPVRAIAESAQQMQGLTSDLLHAAALEAGVLRIVPRDCRAEELLATAAERIHPLAEARELELTCTAAPGLRLRADPERILQVLANLLGNAVKFTPRGGRVHAWAEQRGPQVWFAVRDTGPGIPEDEVPHLFGRYWQGSHRREGGSGLGLAIARGIVEAHGGHMWVTSEVGDGSTFLFALPAS